MSKELIKVCAYCRVSTDSENQVNSFQNQKEYFEEELSEENGFELVDVFADQGTTGTAFKQRDQFNEMLKRAGLDIKVIENKTGSIKSNNTEIAYFVSDREPEFNRIYIKNSSRIARNMGIMDIVRKLREKKVYIYFHDINKNTENEGDDFLISLLSVFDENESKDKSRKVKFGAERSAKNGVVRVGYELYGYTYNKVENTLRIIEDEAEVVKKIFDLRLEGKGTRLISNQLKQDGVKTRRGGDWLPNVIGRTLQNPIYTGRVVRNKWDCKTLYGNNSRVLKPREEWIIQETDRIDRIIDDKTFDKVQELIKESTVVGIKKGKYQGRTKLATKIICEKCGANYVKNCETSRGIKREWYNCRTKKLLGVDKCRSKNVYVKEIDKAICEYLEFGYYKKYAEELFNLLVEELNIKKSYINVEVDFEEVERLEKELNIQKEKMNKLLDLYLEGKIPTNILDSKKEPINEEIKNLEKSLSVLYRTAEERDRMIDSIEGQIKFIKNMNSIYPSEMTIDEFIKNELVNIIVREDGTLYVFTKAHELYARAMNLIKDL